MKCGHLGGGVAAVLDVVERGGPDLQALLVCFVPLGDPRVQVPAVVVETGRLRAISPHLVQRLVFELAEADRDVRDLDAGVVDVVLDLDLAPEKSQQPAERVAERGVPQVTDVGRLVRIDRGVFDDRLGAP